LKTTNGGNSWTLYLQSNIPDLKTIFFLDLMNGFAAGTDGTLSGDEGYIWKTTNGGINWFVNFNGKRYYEIEFINSQIGYAVGADILKTTNEGLIWSNVLQDAGVSSISLIGQNYAWAVGGGGNIVKTTNSGKNWMVLSDGDNYHLNSIDFADKNNGIAVGYGGTIIRTINGGQNWEYLTNIPSSWSLYSVAFPDSQNIWTSGHYGEIYHSSDGGNNWEQQNSGLSIPLRSIYFINNDTGWVAGNSGIILKTTNGGQNWFQLNTGTTGWLHSVFFVNENYGWAAGSYSTLIKTTNGGLTWQTLSIAGVQFFNSVFFLNESVGWLADASSGGTSSIYKTTNGGATWINQLEISDQTFSFNDVYFKNENFGWTVGRYGQIWFTTNGGDNWILQDDIIFNELYSIAYCETDELWIAGKYALILYSINGGIPVEFTSFTGVVLERGVELNWSTATETNNQGFVIERKLHSSEWQKIGFVEGNGTTTETQYYLFTDNDLKPGRYKYRLKQMDYDGTFEYSKIVEVEVGFPTEFSLSQNYPNPFNPTTTIRFTISDVRYTTLKFYDVLGKEVATLVNEEKPPGEYVVEFDAANLPSGVYFYRIKAGSFINTKKMVILR
jgi:photosystem II stability/assembly factor-like uncharacterized protein